MIHRVPAAWPHIRPGADVRQARRERIFNLPFVVLALVAGMGVLHAVRLYVLSNEQDAAFVALMAFVPARLTAQFDAAGVAAAFRALALRGGVDIEYARYFFGDGAAQPWSVLTYAALHADWMHYGVNSVWLAAFGAPVARRFGALRFLVLFVLTALAGAAAHFIFHRFDATPVIGASAAVSGAMAASIRFVFQPGAPLGQALSFDEDETAAYQRPALPLSQVIRDRRALTFIVFWFAMNLIFGIGAQPLGLVESGVAWEAHLGGFLAGLLCFSWIDPRHPEDGRLPRHQIEEDGSQWRS
ncbi:MAG: rhomboid family intramembrane serine protease [Beijerinckiaceae bacterium]|nr:rhomboid family intramembrane serine protease [Beijerinckiaceae bacterium]